HRRVGNNHLVTAFAVLEKIEKSLLFHQTTSKIEICLSVLNAVFPVFVLAPKLEVALETLQHLLENVRHGLLLKNPALHATGKKPDFRHQLCVIACEILVAISLRKPGANSAEVSPLTGSALSR